MPHVSRTAVAIGCMALLAYARTAGAMCASDNQGPCYRYWHTEAVLLGEVTDKVLIDNDGLDEVYRLHVTVVEAFRGVGPPGSSATIYARNGECGFDAAVGQVFFFYAHRRKDDHIWASMDSVSFESSEEDLAYARLAISQKASATVYGEVVHRKDPVLDSSSFTPLSGVVVRVQGKDFDSESVTDTDGQYSVRLPGAGQYQVDVVAPPGLAGTLPTQTAFELISGQDCRRLDFQLLTNGRVRGVVIDEETGQPVANLVLSVGDIQLQTATDLSGTFDIGPLPAGEHQVDAVTGRGSIALRPRTVTVSSGQATDVRTLMGRFSPALASITFDLTGLAGRGWIHIRPLDMIVAVGRQEAVTFALEHGASVNLSWSTEQDVKEARLTVDAEKGLVKLSELAWQSAP